MLKNNLKIAVDIRELKHHQTTGTGTGRFLKLFLDNIDEDKKKNIYLLADSDSNVSLYGYPFNIIKAKAPFTLCYDQVVIPRILKKENIDVFFSPYYKMPFFTQRKRIITIHDLHFLKGILRRGIEHLKPYISYLRQAIKYADRIIAVSEFSKKDIISQFDVEENKVKVVYNGIDEKFRVVDREELDVLKSKYNLNYKYILYVGNMKSHKNIEGLIKAYNLLDNKDNYKLVIIAKKDENFRELKKLVANLSLDDHIMFFDFVPDEELVLFYNFAEAFVFPSFYEGFGLPPLEAMACGAPVISSHTTSLREVLGGAALYVDPYKSKEMSKAISEVLSNDEVRETLRNKGIMQAKKYDSILFSNKLLKEIKTV